MQARVEREIPRNLPGRYAAVLSFVSASTRIIPLIIFSIYKTLHTKYRERQKERERARERMRDGVTRCLRWFDGGGRSKHRGIVTRNTNSWSGNECFNNSLPRGPPVARTRALSKSIFIVGQM